MRTNLCIQLGRWPGLVVRIIVIVIVAAVAGRWQPGLVLPLAAGIALGGWTLTAAPAPAAAARAVTP